MIDRVKDLARRAKNNLNTAAYDLKAGIYEDCCEMCHNAAEKAIKSVLENYNIEYAHIHLIDRLAREALPHVPHLNTVLDKLDFLDSVYMPSRYPHKYAITKEATERCYAIAEDICSLAFTHLGMNE